MPAAIPSSILASPRRIASALCLFMWIAPLAHAQDAPKPQQAVIMNSHGFLAAHPDLRWRQRGLEELRDDQPEAALEYFKRAARYADKPSQAMVAEMLWTGWGTAVDRPLAYAWMDLAAERTYMPFLAQREEYWNALDEAERTRARQVGTAVHAEYGAAVAKPRLAGKLRFGRRTTGSRTGFVGSLKVYLPGGVVDGSHYYDKQYWQPEKYWAWQDRIWKAPHTGRVDVLPLEVVDDEATPPAEDGGDGGQP